MGCGASSDQNQIEQQPYKPQQKLFQTTQSTVLTARRQKLTKKNSDKNNEAKPQRKINRNKQKLTKEQIQQAYEQSNGKLQKMFELLEEKISQYYMQLSVDAVQLLSQHKLNQVQTKVFLSEQFLLQSLQILQVIGQKTDFEYQISVFKRFNKSQSILISYLKQKYPRAGNIFVPGDLNQVFKEFNMVDNPENDLLRKAGISFVDSSTQQIIKKLKIFFNTLLEQLDSKFIHFQSLLQERVFSYELEGKKKSFNYKIGRKLPQNTAKYQIDQTQLLVINSPEVFRMIIKWVIDMEDLLKSPQDQINDRSTFKVYSLQKNEICHDQVTADQCQSILQDLKYEINQLKQPYHQEMEKLLREQDIFNVNLIKILNTTERKQKYVPKNQANVIKYAMYNTKLVSWLMAQKLIKVLKYLIQVGKKMQKKGVGKTVDLIKFNVKDLFRSMVIGNKKQILIVYNNLKKLEQEGKLKIIQIRNRLGTPLNDAMIIFTFDKSFIICELQLVLSQGQGVSEKVKSLQVMNHFLYQMVRSPYGVLSQVAVLLGYKDNKINYEEKITFINNNFTNFSTCNQKHPQKVINQKIQIKPFICTQCTQFFHPYQNIFGYKYCQVCSIFQCCRCLFKNNKQLQKSQVHFKFLQYLYNQMSESKVEKSTLDTLSKNVTIQDILNCFFKQKLFIRQIFDKNYTKLKPKDVHSYMKNQKYNDHIKEMKDAYLSSIYFILVQFKGTTTNVRLLTWNSSLEQIQNCINIKQNFYQLQKVSSSYYDFIMFINTQGNKLIPLKSDVIQKQLKYCIKSQVQNLNIKNYMAIRMNTRSKQTIAYFIAGVQTMVLSKDEGDDKQQQTLAKKQFIYSSIQEARKSLPKVALVLQNFQMKNQGITTSLLKQYFEGKIQAKKIKLLNLNNNKIKDIQVIFNQCDNIENIIVSKNYIKQIKIVKKLQKLLKLILFQNQIVEIKGFSNIPNLNKLNFENNLIKKLQPLNLMFLRQIAGSYNKFHNFKWLQESKLPQLETLIINSSIQSSQLEQSYIFGFPKLKTLKYGSNSTLSLTIKSIQLKFLDCTSCYLKILNVQSKKIQNLNVSSNQLQNLQQILKKKCFNLKQFNGGGAGKLQIFPKLEAQNLQYLNMSSCQLKDLTNLGISNLPKITKIYLDSNLFQTLPQLSFTSLRTLGIEYNSLKNLKNFGNFNLPLLQEIVISGDNQTKLQFPILKLPSLKKLKIQKLKTQQINNLSQSYLPKLEELQFSQMKLQKFPKMHFETLITLNLSVSTIRDFSNFNQSKFQNLQTIYFSNINTQQQDRNIAQQKKLGKLGAPKLKYLTCYSVHTINMNDFLSQLQNAETITLNYGSIQALPVLNLPMLQTLDIQSSGLKNIQNLSKSLLPKLQTLNLYYNAIQVLPKLKIPNLKALNLQNNSLKEITNMNSSNLPNLQQLDFNSNKLEQIPPLKLSKIKTLTIRELPIKSLKFLHNSSLDSLQTLSIQDCNQIVDKEFPVIKFPKLINLQISRCTIGNIKGLTKSKLPELENLRLQASIESLPVIQFNKLTNFSFTGQYYATDTQPLEGEVQVQGDTGTVAQSQPQKIELKDIANIQQWKCPNLKILSIRNSKVQQIPVLNFPKLTQLDFQMCKIKNSQAIRKSQLPQLQCLNLKCNSRLTKIDIVKDCLLDNVSYQKSNFQTFEDFSKFKAINLQLIQCNIVKISKISLQDTEILTLTNNKIQDISEILTQAPKLKQLYIQKNRIKSIPQAFFPYLSTLEASENQISTAKFKQKNYPSITSISLQDNLIQKIQEIQLQQTLVYLYLARNKLKNVNFFKKPAKNTGYKSLYEINLSTNQIQKIQYIPSCPMIRLSQNKLKNLNWIQNIETKNIQTFFLDHNQIQDISSLNKAKFESLYYIYLNDNHIKSFVVPDAKFPALYSLQLYNNKIQIIDNITSQNFPELTSIVLDSNNLKKVGPKISGRKIHTISLRINKQLQKIQGISAPQLSCIQMSECNISSLDWLSSIANKNLGYLRLADNNIKKIPKILATFTQLYEADFSRSSIKDMSQYMEECTRLKKQGGKAPQLTLTYSLSLQLSKQTRKQMTQKIKELVPNSYYLSLSPQEQIDFSNNEAINELKNQPIEDQEPGHA